MKAETVVKKATDYVKNQKDSKQSHWYTGITNNLTRRIKEHEQQGCRPMYKKS